MIGLGLRTLLVKEVRRFLRVPGQTLASPLVTTTLYFVVFGWSLGSRLADVEGVPYARFIAPGLVALGVVSNAYLNSASSLFVMKLQGTIIDILVAPLSHAQVLTGFVAAAVVRGLLVGGVTWLVAGAFTGIGIAHPLWALLMLVLAAVAFGALGVVSNAYLNSASSLFVMKLQGTIVDILVTPLSHAEVLVGFVAAAVLRGLLVGGVTWLVAGLFTGLSVAHPLWALLMLVLAAVAFAAMGVMTAIWAASFEQVNFFPTFVVTPLTFLGGVFYSARMLPPGLQRLTMANPVFYLVDGVRYGFLGISDASPLWGLGILAILAAGSLAGAYAMLASGYKLRS